ncbi:polyhydroxyalkanoate synthesis regulator DNA-binding domain-containing protein [Streptomyces minutiscleroticus]|uniref:PHA accumulation regulator DNA-binding N-terminal domain-containing protein n=1 Tax=Streptomyces minutiscleroticus TaxID=68238 RepID=A0A918U913_9ACTN|nr:polyhydroxyalkanoate synthesis regulator DNA-binding domain-containing protein [Streptomyces minutiscleroticus]GGY09823.1 hypothetical protein GCM10010358_73110 [Streptomyces minutiscleroticus]
MDHANSAVPHGDGTLSRLPEPSERVLTRGRQGDLYDTHEQDRVTLDQLVRDLRAERQFRAYDHDTGQDCTYQVLGDALAHALGGSVGRIALEALVQSIKAAVPRQEGTRRLWQPDT